MNFNEMHLQMPMIITEIASDYYEHPQMHFIKIVIPRNRAIFTQLRQNRTVSITVAQVWENQTKETLTKQIWFRGTLYYRIPLVDQWYLEFIKYGDAQWVLTEALCFPGETNGFKTQFGNRSIFDPRTFGLCGAYHVHSIISKWDINCDDCGKPFMDLIPPIVSGRVIRYLSTMP